MGDAVRAGAAAEWGYNAAEASAANATAVNHIQPLAGRRSAPVSRTWQNLLSGAPDLLPKSKLEVCCMSGLERVQAESF